MARHPLAALCLWLASAGTAGAQDAASVKGVVSLRGEVPKSSTFRAPTEREKAAYPDGVPYDPVAVDAERHVGSALVYVKSGLEGNVFPVPKEPKTLDVERFRLKPRVVGIMAGQELLLTNRDAGVLHAVHALPLENKEFNAGLPNLGDSFRATFSAPELAIKVKTECLHDWELAWIAVLPHPFHAVTDDQGRFEIRGLPPGKYVIEAWQENCDPVRKEILLGEKEQKAVDFALEADVRAHLFISGRVQGVGFRASAEQEAKRIGGVVGWVRNLNDGRVEAVVQGPKAKVDRLVEWCRKGPATAEVTKLERGDETPTGRLRDFSIRLY